MASKRRGRLQRQARADVRAKTDVGQVLAISSGLRALNSVSRCVVLAYAAATCYNDVRCGDTRRRVGEGKAQLDVVAPSSHQRAGQRPRLLLMGMDREVWFRFVVNATLARPHRVVRAKCDRTRRE